MSYNAASKILDSLSEDKLKNLTKELLKALEPYLTKAINRGVYDENLIPTLMQVGGNDVLYNSELLGRFHYIIDDTFGDAVDKEIEHSMLGDAKLKSSHNYRRSTSETPTATTAKNDPKRPNRQTVNSKQAVALENEGASTISHSIYQSREFTNFKNESLRRLGTTVTHLVDNFDTEFSNKNSVSVLSEIIEPRGGTCSGYNASYASDSESSFGNGSVNHNSFMFFDDSHLRLVAENLNKSKSEKVRLRALHDLLNYAPNEVISIDNWKLLCKGLIAALGDSNQEIATACLILHSRVLATAHPNVVCETLTNLVEHLLQWFPSQKEILSTSVLDVLSSHNDLTLKQIRLLLEFLQETTKYWMRHSESFVEHVVNETIRLFSFGSILENNLGELTPLHFVSLLDPHANWFRTWMHAFYSRNYVLKSLKNSKAFLRNTFQSVVNYAYLNQFENNNYGSSGIKKRSIGTASPEGSTSTLTYPALASLQSNNPMTHSFISTISYSTTSPPNLYSRSEIENCHFLHSLSILEHIVCLRQGRDLLFPIQYDQSKEVSVKELIRVIIQIMFSTSGYSSFEKSPSSLCCSVLKRLCMESDTCQMYICTDDLFEYLLRPIKQFLSSKKVFMEYMQTQAITSENGLLKLAELFSAIASNDYGYHYLLRGKHTTSIVHEDLLNQPNTPALLIVQYVKRILTQYSLSKSSQQTPEPLTTNIYNLISDYVYVCRLIYSRSSGLLAIKRANLHRTLADTFKNEVDKEQDKTISPQLRTSHSADSERSVYRLHGTWKETLRDNLLLYSATPKGVYLLTQTGLLGECISYLDDRYRSKRQVGKLERFGYGYLISQLSNTAAVAAALKECGFIQCLVEELWAELEHVPDDLTSVFPRRFPSEPISRYAQKPMLCLLTVTSSFAAAYEIFYDESLTPRQDSTINDKPLDLLGLLDRIAFVCDDDSVRNLLCYEHTHTTGLRMLGIMQMDMDIQLMLEVKYDYVKKLRRAQTDNQADSLVVFDQLAMARNHVLVNAEVIGGPNEKIVPSWTMNETDAACPYPLFGEGDVPDFYKIKISYANSKLDDSELLRLIRNSRPDRLDDRWLTKCRHVFMSALKSQAQDIPVQLMSDLLDAVVDIYEKIHIDVLFNMNRDLSSSTSSSTTVLNNRRHNENEITKLSANSGLTNLQERGVQKAINYGAQIGLVHDVNLAKQNVTKLLKAVKSHLKQRSQSIRPNLSLINGSSMNEIKLNFNQSIDYPGYDWFVTSIFFLMHCDEVRAWRWLRTFSLLLPSGFLWCARLYNSPFISADMVQYTIHPIYAGTTHAVELIIENEMSQVFFAFRMSGLAPSHIAYQWIKQCFWNYLDWPEIVTYLTLCILYGIDYQVYYCVSIFKYLQNDIIKQHSARNLLPFLKCHQIRGFSARDYIDFMVSLEKRYRSILMPELKELVCFSTNNRNTN